ncbi:hypothetical protein [Chlorobaculum parvum]|uniref:hypothetical protein n=1 Tax=Chlorobaculum parvum TaxID=274539 RepID=UPI00059D3458|nr:hypothetical protein [Chlorobaculum parvum]
MTKSGDDEYFLYVLSTSITSNEIALAQVQTKLGRAIARRPALTTSLLEGSKDCWVRDSATGAVHEATQFALDGERFSKSLELVAKGIYFHHFGERWEGKLHVRADFIDFPHEPNAADIQEARMALASYADELFKVEPKHGSNPDVFWYQVHTPCEGPRCLLRMGFFGGSRAIAFFGELRTRG